MNKKFMLWQKKLLTDKTAYKKMASAANPYGDGLSSRRTIQIIKNYFGLSKKQVKEFVRGKLK